MISFPFMNFMQFFLLSIKLKQFFKLNLLMRIMYCIFVIFGAHINCINVYTRTVKITKIINKNIYVFILF